LQVVQIAIDYPINAERTRLEFLMEHRHLWLRSPRQHAILRIRARIIKANPRLVPTRTAFLLVDTPILTPARGRGDDDLVRDRYFGTPAYLTKADNFTTKRTSWHSEKCTASAHFPRGKIKNAGAT